MKNYKYYVNHKSVAYWEFEQTLIETYLFREFMSKDIIDTKELRKEVQAIIEDLKNGTYYNIRFLNKLFAIETIE